MGVYIKGMEMPKSCLACPFKEYGYGDEFKYYCSLLDACIGRWNGRKIETERLADCPLVEVKTPHDRLIDAGIYKKLLADDSKLWVLGHTPAVIEAEVEK